MATLMELFVKLGVDSSGYEKGLHTAEGKAQSASSGISKAVTTMASVVGAAFAADKIISFGKAAIDAASDLNETVSKSRVVFEDMSSSVERMGNTSATALGLSKNEAIAAAATYGNLFTSMGMTTQESAAMSTNLVKLAADFASFNNIPVAEALDKIRAGLVGETEPLKSLGVNINEASIKAEALAMGLYKGTGALSASAKAQASYNLILKQSTNAQGDFARTASGAANQQRILDAQLKDLTATLGQQLLPAWTKILNVVVQVVDTGNKVLNWGDNIQAVLQQHSEELVAAGGEWQEYAREMVRAQLASHGFVGTEAEVQEAIRLTEGGLNGLMKQWNFSTEAQYANAQANKVLTAAYAANTAMMKNSTQGQEDYSRAVDLAGLASDNAKLSVDAFSRSQDDLALAARDLLTNSMRPLTTELIYQQAAAGLDSAAALELARGLGLVDEKTYAATKKLQDLRTATDLNKDGMISAAEAANGFNQAVLDIANNTDAATIKLRNMSMSDWLITVRADFSDLDAALAKAGELNRMGTVNIKGPTFSWTQPTFTSPTTTGTTATGGTGGGRALGGPVAAFQPVLVGELGPEIFMPPVSGTILPNEAIGGHVTNIYVSPHYYRGDEPSVGQELALLAAMVR